LPLAPISGLIKLGEVLQDQVDNELHGRSAVRGQLEELEEARSSGSISEEEELRGQREILGRAMGRPGNDQSPESATEEER